MARARVSKNRRDKIVDLYVEGKTRAQIVEETGISSQTVKDVFNEPGFEAAARTIREERRRRVRDMIEHLSIPAVQVHGLALTNKATPVQLQAAQSVLDRVGVPRVQVAKTDARGDAAAASSAMSTETAKVAASVSTTGRFNDRTDDELRHYIEFGRYPDGTQP